VGQRATSAELNADHSGADTARPGVSVRMEAPYRRLDCELRAYWECGENADLTPPQHRILRQRAAAAARYGGSGERIQTETMGSRREHGIVVRSVMEFVHHAMPRGDIEGSESPPRPLGRILETGVGGRCPVSPPDAEGRRGAPGWVCINATVFAGALLRELGYPVRECNVYLAQSGSFETGLRGAVYQETALQVWFSGGWHWADPYLAVYDPAATRDDRSAYKIDRPYFWSRPTPPREWRFTATEDGWRPFSLDDPLGTGLQQRFQPPPIAQRSSSVTGERHGAHGPRVKISQFAGERRTGTATSGVFIRTRCDRVRFSLRDRHGRVTGTESQEIPGGVHIRSGAPVPHIDPRIAGTHLFRRLDQTRADMSISKPYSLEPSRCWPSGTRWALTS